MKTSACWEFLHFLLATLLIKHIKIAQTITAAEHFSAAAGSLLCAFQLIAG